MYKITPRRKNIRIIGKDKGTFIKGPYAGLKPEEVTRFKKMREAGKRGHGNAYYKDMSFHEALREFRDDNYGIKKERTDKRNKTNIEDLLDAKYKLAGGKRTGKTMDEYFVELNKELQVRKWSTDNIGKLPDEFNRDISLIKLKEMGKDDLYDELFKEQFKNARKEGDYIDYLQNEAPEVEDKYLREIYDKFRNAESGMVYSIENEQIQLSDGTWVTVNYEMSGARAHVLDVRRTTYADEIMAGNFDPSTSPLSDKFTGYNKSKVSKVNDKLKIIRGGR